MSQQGLPGFSNQSQPGIPTEKPRSDIYTVMLFIALLSVGVAIGLLCSEMSRYDWDWKAENVAKPPTSWLDEAPRDVLGV